MKKIQPSIVRIDLGILNDNTERFIGHEIVRLIISQILLNSEAAGGGAAGVKRSRMKSLGHKM